MIAPGEGEGIDVGCDACGRPLRVAKTLKGGLTNCPGCGKLVEVRGGLDLEFAALVALGVLVVLGATAAAWAVAGKTAAIVALVAGAACLAAIILAS